MCRSSPEVGARIHRSPARHPRRKSQTTAAIGKSQNRATRKSSCIDGDIDSLLRPSLVSRVGFEPTTKGLKVPCSTTELPARLGPYHVQIGCPEMQLRAIPRRTI